jgi:hypothetical protein
MKRIIASLIAALAVGAAATSVMKSHSLSHLGYGAMPTVQELQSSPEMSKLPVQDFEDRSLVFPREAAR